MTLHHSEIRVKPKPLVPPGDRAMVSEDTACALLSISKPLLRRYAASGLIPRVIMPEGVRRNLYRVSDLEMWVDRLPSKATCVGMAATGSTP